ncbi:hypothetical protein ACP4OV_008354 [Aristida adscensionis]
MAEDGAVVPACAAAAAPDAGGDGGGADGGGAAGDVVSVRRSVLAARLTCPLCGRLLRDAATITECLHTYIFNQFVGSAYLRSSQIRKSAAALFAALIWAALHWRSSGVDHSLQYIRSKVFPSKRQKVEAPEVSSPVTLPIKRKERSLSSLTVHAPQVSTQKCLTKRRTKASCLRNTLHSTLRGSNITKKVGGWRSLGCHFRAAKNKKSLRTNSEDVHNTEIKSDNPVDKTSDNQAKTKRQLIRQGNLKKRTGNRKLLVLKGKQKKFKPKLTKKKRRRFRALWKGQPPLPQVPSKFLRIKDVDLPASFIQKYLVQKLNISSEAEVEILCGGKTVSQGMTLHDLVDFWLDKGPKGRVQSSVGTAAAGFVVTVFYGRAELPPTENNQG